MKIALNWLKSYIQTDLTASALASLLTQSGLEVIRLYPAIPLEGLVIGEVIASVPHPRAERLHKTLVDIGADQPLSIICGAPNLAVGQKVMVAPAATTIYSYSDQKPFQIKKIKIRGEWSDGMICAEDEIGLGPAHDAIMVLDTALPAGTAAKDYLQEPLDELLEIEITPNRADACSHLGIARELKALLHLPLVLPTVAHFQPIASPPLTLTVQDNQACPRYCGLLLKNVVVEAAPQWLRTRLSRIGIKPINNIVDVTNFILHDLGQPLHAFDYDTIVGGCLEIALATPGSQFIGLDGVTRTLTGCELMIGDALGPLAMAGIIGGMRSCITKNTKNVFIESGYFHPTRIRRAAQYHNLKTEAAFRFERGTDPHMPPYALKRAALLLQLLLPSAEAIEIIEYYPTPIAYLGIAITYAAIARTLGVSLDPTKIKEIINDLDIDIEEESKDGFIAKVPPYRVDVTRTADLIEEIARIYGYDALADVNKAYLTPAINYLAAETSTDYLYEMEEEIGKLLVSNGYYEIWTNSLIARAYVDLTHSSSIISLLNPSSKMVDSLRPTLLFSGLEAIAYNMSYRQKNLKFFEFGTVYNQVAGVYKERKKLALWLTGHIEPANWVRQLGDVTLQEMRNSLEQIIQRLGIEELVYKAMLLPHYIQAAQIIYKGKEIIAFGQIDGAILDRFAIAQPVFFADIDWDNLLKIGKFHPRYRPIAKFPPVRRDLSLVVDKSVSFQDIQDVIVKRGVDMVQAVHLFDLYTGATLPADKKAYALTFILQDSKRTLDDSSIHQFMDQLMQAFEQVLHATIRK